ncbi:MAG: cysteine desulfurase family protein [Ethanoligenens sp.]
MSFVYLDNSATTRVCKEAVDAALHAMTVCFGNPSSLHGMGVAAEELVGKARGQVAAALGCEPREIIFTSGGTEANNLALFGAARALSRRGRRIVTTAIEHSSVEGPAAMLEKEGFEVVRLRPDASGAVPEQALFKEITPDTVLVSMMLVNNETGALQPVQAIRRAVRRAGAPALVHVDAVQAFGKVPFNPSALGADLVSVSGHKIHGPKGAGALFVARGTRILPVLVGGGQEHGLRPGTEPVPAIAGFGAAAEQAQTALAESGKHFQRMRALALRLCASLPVVTINSPENGAPHILNVSVEGVRSETMLHFLAQRDIYVSSGSACARGAKSRVLVAMGLPDARVDTALRVSFSRYNTEEEVERLFDAVAAGVQTLAHR